MGFHVGLPFLKLSLNPSTQKHNGKAAKTCSVSSAWDEMNDKRRGRDKSIDHDLTKDNVWICGSSDMDLEEVIQAEIDRINQERADQGKRKLRKDAVSAIEMIQKPPMEYMMTLTREEQTKLLRDSDEVVESIFHDWAPEWKTLATVIHYDEFGGRSGHPHKIFMPIARDEDGCPVLNAKRYFNLKFFTFMNREYPVRMRERGYPVLDCEIYEDMTEEEQEVHKEKKKDYGLEGYEYKMKKTAEQEAKITANEQLIEAQEQKLSVINEDVQKAQSSLESKNKKVEAAKATISKQKEENKALGIKILSKKQVADLPEPPKTLDGNHYKVPVKEYKSLVATAGQVDVMKQKAENKEKALLGKEKELNDREKEIEKKRTLPIAERMELAVLRKFKESMEWLVEQDFVPGIVKKLISQALSGIDLRTQSENLDRGIHRARSLELLR
jgi:hypothetical protein